jgi:hypothetical protein
VSYDSTSLVIFRMPRVTGEVEESSMVSEDYCRARERAERAAAKGACSIEARRVHQELAQAYAYLAQRKEPA